MCKIIVILIYVRTVVELMNEFCYNTVRSATEKQILCRETYVFIFIVSFTALGTFSALHYYVALMFRIFTTSFGRVTLRHFEFLFSLICFLAFFFSDGEGGSCSRVGMGDFVRISFSFSLFTHCTKCLG